MKLRKLLALSLAGALSAGVAVSVSAAELDTVWYAANNPDVVAELGNSPEALRLHYEMFGRKEGRMANTHDVEAQLRKLFHAEEYAALYPDVKDFYGEDEEALFQHYISYGLLEARRPSEKVSYEAAVALKTSIVTAMEKAGLSAVPGSAEVVAVIEGNTAIAGTDTAAAQVMSQVTAEVEKAVEETAASTEAPASSSSGGGSSSSGSSSSSGDSGNQGTTSADDSGDNGDAVTANEAVVANLVDKGNPQTVSDNDLEAVKSAISINTEGKKSEDVEYTLVTVATSGDTAIPKHKNGEGTEAYWFGIGVPKTLDTNGKGIAGWAASEDGAVSEMLTTSSTGEKDDEMGSYYTYYWGWTSAPMDTAKKYGYLVVEAEGSKTYYVINFSGLKLKESE